MLINMFEENRTYNFQDMLVCSSLYNIVFSKKCSHVILPICCYNFMYKGSLYLYFAEFCPQKLGQSVPSIPRNLC